MKRLTYVNSISAICLGISALAMPLQSQANSPASDFFNQLKAHCGKAYAGKISVDTPQGDAFQGQELVMHVRECNEQEIRIPFHVGDDRSRTWVVRYDQHGLSLKHDHRHKDGSEDSLTQYGGTTTSIGYDSVQSFPADEFTKQLFADQKIPQSMDNIWQIFLYPEQFTYRMYRPAREFRVDFDLTQPIEAPPAPWGADQ